MKKAAAILLAFSMILALAVPAAAESEAFPAAFQVFFSGIDNRGPIVAESRSDANVLITVNTDTRQILLVHIPRDYYIEFAGTGGRKDKLTHCGMLGIQTMLDSINAFFDTDVRYYIRFNFQGFMDFINEIGGVDVYSEYTFDSKNMEGFHFEEGYNNVDGEGALAYSRERFSYNSGDRQRGRNQMYVIKAAVEAFSNGSILRNFKAFLDATNGTYEMNIPLGFVTQMLLGQTVNPADWNVVICSVDGYDSSANGTYVMEPDLGTVEKAKELMRRVLAGEVLDQEKDAPRGSVVDQLEDLANSDLAKQVQAALNEAGFDCGTVDGMIGPNTRASIAAFQKAKGLTVTQRIDKELLQALGIEPGS